MPSNKRVPLLTRPVTIATVRIAYTATELGIQPFSSNDNGAFASRTRHTTLINVPTTVLTTLTLTYVPSTVTTLKTTGKRTVIRITT